jgi:hypothetical protein
VHEQDPVKYVQTLLDVYVKFSDVVKTAFENDSAFVASLDKVRSHRVCVCVCGRVRCAELTRGVLVREQAMRQVVNDNPINKRTTKSPELLAKYSDFILSKSNKTFEDDKLDQMLNQVVRLPRHGTTRPTTRHDTTRHTAAY